MKSGWIGSVASAFFFFFLFYFFFIYYYYFLSVCFGVCFKTRGPWELLFRVVLSCSWCFCSALFGSFPGDGRSSVGKGHQVVLDGSLLVG